MPTSFHHAPVLRTVMYVWKSSALAAELSSGLNDKLGQLSNHKERSHLRTGSIWHVYKSIRHEKNLTKV